MKRLRNMGGYEEATIVTARAAAAQMGFIQSPEGELRGDGEYDGDLVTDFEPGVFKYLAPGETVVVPPVTKPSGELDPFMRLMLRGVAAGTGVSYESISRDFTGTSYSSARASILDERDNWKSLQAWVIRSFHKRVFCEWIELAVLAGVLDLPGYETAPEKYEKVKWMPRGWSWIDPTKEVSAYKEAIKGGLLTLTEAVAQDGRDFDEMLQIRKREIDWCDEAEVLFDTDWANSQAVMQSEISQQQVDNQSTTDQTDATA
jgi:lambda family phage portal protein